MFRVEEYRVPNFSVVVEAKPEVGQTAHAHVSSAFFHGAPNVGARVHWKATWTSRRNHGSEEQNYKKRFNSYGEIGPHLDADNEELKSIEGDAKLDEHGFADLACESPFKNSVAIGRADVFWRADVTSLDGQTITGGDTGKLFPAPSRLGIKVTERSENRAASMSASMPLIRTTPKVTGVAVHADLYHVTTKTVKEQLAPFVYRYRNSDQFAKIASKDTYRSRGLQFSGNDDGPLCRCRVDQ